MRRRLKRILSRALPLWMVFVLVLYSMVATGVLEYYLMKRNFDAQVATLAKSTQNSDELIQILKQEVLPRSGYQLAVRWNDLGQQLVDSGAIDRAKYDKLFTDDYSRDQMKYLSGMHDHMLINEQNSRFMVNTLWALGLVNKNKILEEGPMKTHGGDVMNLASTGGWTLGSKPVSQLYSSREIIPLTPDQQEIVKKIARSVFRPCCDNSTEFPDCNHGMAALGYIEVAVAQGVAEEQIYKDLLAINSFWFPQQYVMLAAYMRQQGVEWENVDAKLALSAQYSSAQGAQKVRQSVQGLPGFGNQSGGCGV